MDDQMSPDDGNAFDSNRPICQHLDPAWATLVRSHLPEIFTVILEWTRYLPLETVLRMPRLALLNNAKTDSDCVIYPRGEGMGLSEAVTIPLKLYRVTLKYAFSTQFDGEGSPSFLPAPRNVFLNRRLGREMTAGDVFEALQQAVARARGVRCVRVSSDYPFPDDPNDLQSYYDQYFSAILRQTMCILFGSLGTMIVGYMVAQKIWAF